MDSFNFHCIGTFKAFGDDDKDYLVKVYLKRIDTSRHGSEFRDYIFGSIKYLEANGESIRYVSKGCYKSDDGILIETDDITAP